MKLTVKQGAKGRWRWTAQGSGWMAVDDVRGHGSQEAARAEWDRLVAEVSQPAAEIAARRGIFHGLFWMGLVVGVAVALRVVLG